MTSLLASAAFAVFHSLWSLRVLLCPGSSPGALRLRQDRGSTLTRLEDEARRVQGEGELEKEKPESLADLWTVHEWCEPSGIPSGWALCPACCKPSAVAEGEDQHAQKKIQLVNGTRTDILKFLLVTMLPLVCDFGSDLISTRNYMAGGHVIFGTGTLSLFIYTAVKDWRKWVDLPEQVWATLRRGYQTPGLWELRKGEVEDEALLSLLINLYGLPWAVYDNGSLAQQFFFLGLSAKAVVERLVQRDLGL